jgi:hypothetical protein
MSNRGYKILIVGIRKERKSEKGGHLESPYRYRLDKSDGAIMPVKEE